MLLDRSIHSSSGIFQFHLACSGKFFNHYYEFRKWKISYIIKLRSLNLGVVILLIFTRSHDNFDWKNLCKCESRMKFDFFPASSLIKIALIIMKDSTHGL